MKLSNFCPYILMAEVQLQNLEIRSVDFLSSSISANALKMTTAVLARTEYLTTYNDTLQG
jgi:hypothetical protein